MREIKILLLVLISTGFQFGGFAQKIQKDYFQSPLKIGLYLSGTFGELRSNHFHTGLDIKTYGRIGLEVYAAADGYVSRIKISPYGYGKALYIRHPNGYTTVYGHLDHFNTYIDSIVKEEQYKRKNFEIDYFPDKDLIQISKGQLVAYSGNNGGSDGPHLHFEIRNSAEKPLNPMNFGINIQDTIKPAIQAIKIYFIENNQLIDFKDFSYYKGSIGLKKSDTIYTSRSIYFGIKTTDQLNGASNKNGVYSVCVKLDSTIVYRTFADKLDFDEQRYINSFLDYKIIYNESERYRITRKQPGNKLSIYESLVNNGIIILDDQAHLIQIEVSDFEDNTSKIEFYVKNKFVYKFKEAVRPNFFYNHSNHYEIADANIIIPEGCLYEDIYFNMRSISNKYSTFSQMIEFGNPEIPLHSYATISIKADSTLPKKYYSKAALASLTKQNKIYYEGGKYSNGWVTGKTRSFGRYFIVVDSVAPIVKELNLYNRKNISNQSSLEFLISDNLSGIKSYSAYVNKKWVLGEYDPKKNLLTFPIDDHFDSGNLLFELFVSDDKNNLTKLTFSLTN